MLTSNLESFNRDLLCRKKSVFFTENSIIFWSIIVITVKTWRKVDFENSNFEFLKIINVNHNFHEIINYNRNFENTLRKLSIFKKWIIMWFIIDIKDTFNRDFFDCNFFKYSRNSNHLFFSKHGLGIENLVLD